jgi:hypothetical protein
MRCDRGFIAPDGAATTFGAAVGLETRSAAAKGSPGPCSKEPSKLCQVAGLGGWL